MRGWKVVYYSTAVLAILSAILLTRAYHTFETGHSGSRGFVLLLPLFLAPVFLGILIWFSVAMAKRWKELTLGERIFGAAACLPMIFTWLRFVPHF